MKMLKRFTTVILITLIFLVFAAYTLWKNIEADNERYTSIKADIVDMKFDYILGVMSENYQKAKIQIDSVGDAIVSDVISVIPSPERRSYYLNRLSEPIENPIIDIIGNRFQKVFLNVESDANDPWAANLHGIINDLSKDCEAQGRSRTFDVELGLHKNPALGDIALDRIKTLKPLDIEGGRLDDVIFWEFREKVGDRDWVYIKDMTIPALHEVFVKHSGDPKSLETYEFLYPHYIFSDRDIAGTPIVSDRGMWQGDKSFPIIITQGWNLYDALMSDQAHRVALKNFDYHILQVEERRKADALYKNIMLLALVITFMIVQLSTVNIIHNETKRVYEEGIAEADNERA